MRVADRHKGKVSFRVEVQGRTGHSSAAPQAVNAVSYAARLITAIDELGRTLRAQRDDSFAVPHPTLSIGPIRGGVSTNIVPETCWFEFELRYLPGHDSREILEQISAGARSLQDEMRVTAEESVIELHQLSAYPPLSPTSPPVAVPFSFDAAAERIAVDFGTEAGLYHDRLGVPVVVCGPGDMAQAHRADEYIELAQLQALDRLGGQLSTGCASRDGGRPPSQVPPTRSPTGACAASGAVRRSDVLNCCCLIRRGEGGNSSASPDGLRGPAVGRSGCDPRPSYDKEPRSPAGPSGSTAR